VVKKSGTMLLLPGKRKNSFKLDSKPFPTIEAVVPSKIAQTDHGLGDIKAWEPPPSWNVPSITTSASVGQILDGQQPTAESHYSAIYGVRPHAPLGTFSALILIPFFFFFVLFSSSVLRFVSFAGRETFVCVD